MELYDENLWSLSRFKVGGLSSWSWRKTVLYLVRLLHLPLYIENPLIFLWKFVPIFTNADMFEYNQTQKKNGYFDVKLSR